jgi:preprotein translocase subunit Sss1
MDELLRLVFVSLGTLGIIGYLVYVALSESTFSRRR